MGQKRNKINRFPTIFQYSNLQVFENKEQLAIASKHTVDIEHIMQF